MSLLPPPQDYPDYYEVIKRPIDLDKIGVKLKSGQYETLEDLLSDFVLMFDNACKYNEPDSQIYKVSSRNRNCSEYIRTAVPKRSWY